MKHIFVNSAGGLRNGWWICVFIALMIASRFAYTPVSRMLQDLGTATHALEPLRFGFLLVVTWICVRLRRERLSSVGFVLDRGWASESAAGAAVGLASALLVAALIWVVGGARFELDPSRSLAALGYGAYLFVFVSLFEETLFRGFVFQRLVAGTGPTLALIASGLVFATSHWGNPEMQGATLAWATIELFLGAVLLGLAYLRTRSLALPIGLHFGWNFAHGSLMGFDVSGFEQTGWFRPVLQDLPEWVTGGDFGPEASVYAVLVDVLLIVVLWRWRGTAVRRDAADARSSIGNPGRHETRESLGRFLPAEVTRLRRRRVRDARRARAPDPRSRR